MIVSPSTGYLLEDDSTFSAKSKGGASSERDVYLQRGVVNSITAVPGGGNEPFTAATETVNLAKGTEKPTLPTTTSQSTTSTSQTTTSGTQSATSTAAATNTAGSQTTTSTPQS
jgi:hypothetical protein